MINRYIAKEDIIESVNKKEIRKSILHVDGGGHFALRMRMINLVHNSLIFELVMVGFSVGNFVLLYFISLGIDSDNSLDEQLWAILTLIFNLAFIAEEGMLFFILSKLII